VDRITLKNMVFFGYHGALQEERDIGGRFEVDIDLMGDFSTPSESDELSDAVDYQKAYFLIKEKIEGTKYHLIEKIAGEVAKEILSTFTVNKVTVRIRKTGKGMFQSGE